MNWVVNAEMDINGVKRATITAKGTTKYTAKVRAFAALREEICRLQDGAEVYTWMVISHNGDYDDHEEIVGTVRGGELVVD